MSLSTAIARLRAGLKAAAFLTVAGFAAGAAAADAQKADVYLGVFEDEQKPIVVFVFSDPSSPEFQEIDATALFAKPDYQPEDGKFNAEEACLWTADYSVKQVPEQLRFVLLDKPIYGPNSRQKTIDPASLPSFFAREATGLLIANKMLESEEAAAPYFNCTGYVWARLLSQPPKFWDETYKQLLEEKKN